jgi:hypothetical protein
MNYCVTRKGRLHSLLHISHIRNPHFIFHLLYSKFDLPKADKCLLASGELGVQRSSFNTCMCCAPCALSRTPLLFNSINAINSINPLTGAPAPPSIVLYLFSHLLTFPTSHPQSFPALKLPCLFFILFQPFFMQLCI